MDKLTLQVVANFERKAADEIDVRDLPPEQEKLTKAIGHQPVMAWEGIHGYIVDFKGPTRFTKEFLHKLTSSSVFRWIEADRHREGFLVGM